jgi:diguanylate cyclase (GGDEF)-like protein/PAS domain S-box-containing protein
MDQVNYKDILDNVYSGVYLVDCERRINYWNKGAEEITGYTADSMIAHFCYDNFLMHVDEEGKVLCHDGCPLAATIQDGKEREAHVYLRHKNGYRVPVMVHASPLRDQNGEITGAIETFSDNTALFDARQNITHLSDELMKDNLTGISNRKYAEIMISDGIKDFVSAGINSGLIFLDIDHFKQINDICGHDTGDSILKMIAKTIANNVRANDIVARWGGEEFVVLLDHINPKAVTRVAEKIRKLVAASSYRDGDRVITATISIGATLLQPGDTVDSAIKRADQLMYQSKEAGRNTVTADMV